MLVFSFLFLSVHVDFGYEILRCCRDMLHEHSHLTRIKYVFLYGSTVAPKGVVALAALETGRCLWLKKTYICILYLLDRVWSKKIGAYLFSWGRRLVHINTATRKEISCESFHSFLVIEKKIWRYTLYLGIVWAGLCAGPNKALSRYASHPRRNGQNKFRMQG
jgi:hypothetical protein